VGKVEGSIVITSHGGIVFSIVTCDKSQTPFSGVVLPSSALTVALFLMNRTLSK
jgi:hypothetical protein